MSAGQCHSSDFVILIALGVDYSIFLLDRFKERCTLALSKVSSGSMSKMGSVIITAAIILPVRSRR
ncbi:MMPL family transporter [Bacillus subtilis]